MRLADFQYHLPPELIAQDPVYPRDASRLLVLHRSTGELEHRIFSDLPEYLTADDVLVLNDSKVIPARLEGRKPTGANIEILLLKRLDERRWEALVSPGRRARPGSVVLLNDGVQIKIGERTEAGGRIVEFNGNAPVSELLKRYGRTPLPPYIKKELKDPGRYQTIYAREEGSAAAPTAGLHFTERLLEQIRQKGVSIVYLTLHIGLDTFRPIHEDIIEKHRMHSEEYEISGETAETINSAKGRVIAVGTTCVRALESAATEDGKVMPGRRSTSLFIMPGYQFRVVDALITNFHLPGSTLLVLVSAFAGRELILYAYQQAIQMRYRFYSFGDAMLIL
jgi:S-adenosylmethionine:tRNA ribosyltransferase-isomerase